MPLLVPPSGSSHLVVSSDTKSVTGTAGLIYSELPLTEFDDNKITFKIQRTFCDKPITFAGVTQTDPDDFSTNPPPTRMIKLPKTWCVRPDGAKFELASKVATAGTSIKQKVGDVWSIQTTDGQVLIYHNNEERWGSPAFQINQGEDTWAVISLGASSTTITEIIGDAPLHKDIIRKLYFILRNHISGPVILDMIAHMFSAGTLTKEDMDLCKAQPTDAEKVDQVLDIILVNPKEGYFSFLRAAEVSGKTYLPEILTNKSVVASVNVSVKSQSPSSEIQEAVEKVEEELLQKYQQIASEVESLINDLKRKILFLTKGSINFFVLCPDQDSLDELLQSGEKLRTLFFKALDIEEIRARLEDPSLNVQVKINEYFVTEDKKICSIYDVPEVLHHQLHGHSHEVRALLEGGVSPDTCWPDGVSGLHVAVSTRNIDLAKVLLDFKADVNIKNTRGNTPLHLISCATEINPEIFTLAKLLFDHNADINIQNVNGETPLHLACKIGSVQLAKVLLETKPGIDKSILTKDGLSYISLAHKHNHLDCVKVLKENGFDLNLNFSPPLPIDEEEETSSKKFSEQSSSTIAKGRAARYGSQHLTVQHGDENTAMHITSPKRKTDVSVSSKGGQKEMTIGTEVQKKIGVEIAKIIIDKEQCDGFRGDLGNMKFGYLRESIQIRKYFGVKDLNGWLKEIQKICELPLKQMEFIKKGFRHCGRNESKLVDIKFMKNELHVIMILFAFYKHPDGLFDIIYAIYVLEVMQKFTYQEKKLPTKRLGGLYSKEETQVCKVSPPSNKFKTLKTHPGCDHYFRLKAVEAFVAEGLVERSSLEHVKGIREYKVLHVEPFPDEQREKSQSYRFLQDAICSIEYNTDAASLFEKKIEKYKTSNWQEDMIMRKFLDINNFHVFIQDLGQILELDEKNILEIECIYRYAIIGQVSKMEFNYESGSLCTRYLFVALSKHTCNSTSDFVYAQYELKAEKNRLERDEDSHRSLLWGAIKYKKTQKIESVIHLNEFEDLKNDPNKYDYCRKRLLDKCIVDRVVQLPRNGSPKIIML